MRNKILHTPWLVTLLFIGLGLTLVACGGEEESAKEPTVPPASPTPIPTAIFKQPTTIITPRAVQNTPSPAGAATPDLARGERIYTMRGCAECHGAQGEGVEGKGSALAGTTLTFEEFSDILRTGGRGKLGNEHIFGPQMISPGGMEALYAYVQSFSNP